MKINRSKLLFWVDIISGMLPTSKSTLNIHKSIILKPTDDGRSIHIQANSDVHAFDIGPIEVTGEPFSVAIDAQSLKHSLSASGDVVSIEDNDDAILVTVGDAQFDLSKEKIDAFTFPENEGPYNTVKTIAKKDLLSMISGATPYLGKDSTQPHLMGVLVVNNYLYATDVLQAIRFDTGISVSEEPLNFIPETVIAFLNAGGKDEAPISIAMNDNWVMVSGGPFRIYSRRFSLRGEFAYDRIDSAIEACKALPNTLELNVKSFQEGIERVSYFANGGLVRIVVNMADIRIEAFQGKRVRAKAKISGVSNRGEATEYLLTLSHLQVLAKTEDDTLRFRIGGSTDPWYMGSEGQDCFTTTAVIG